MELTLKFFSRKPKASENYNKRLKRITNAEQPSNVSAQPDTSPPVEKPTDLKHTTELKDAVENYNKRLKQNYNKRLKRTTNPEQTSNVSAQPDTSPPVEKPTDLKHTTELKDAVTHKRRSVHNIAFRTLASDRPNSGEIYDKDLHKAQMVLRNVFSPSSPVLNIDFFAGRVKEITRAVSALENEGMHLVIHGKRGLGKTSFANTLCGIAKNADYIVCNTSSSQHSTYSEIFRSFLKEIPLLYDLNFVTNHEVDTRKQCFDTLLPKEDFSPKELTKILLRLTSTRLLFVIDEFDRNQTPGFQDSILETIKNFSDNCVRANLVLIGATDTVDDLIGLNESVRRNISGIPIKAFDENEVEELFNIGEEVSGVYFPKDIRMEISRLARHVPYSMRLLCLHAAQSSVAQGSWTVSNKDLFKAISLSIMGSESLINADLLELLHSKKLNHFEDFLYAISDSECNDHSEFYSEQAAQSQRDFTHEPATALSVWKQANNVMQHVSTNLN